MRAHFVCNCMCRLSLELAGISGLGRALTSFSASSSNVTKDNLSFLS